MVRDAILAFFKESKQQDASIAEVLEAVQQKLGSEVPESSVRSSLRLHTPDTFQRVSRGRYRLVRGK
ncbi:hypothetical protein DKM27_15095 [Mycobacterium tuberculosis variant bovis]|uniref:HTH HARE-type domain-containing protein n=2 Tax=Mycobacterium avium complex (MAC) TaxID=120793 RepID=A0ABX3TFH6_9MYCO|nr:hypothetical protein BST19_23440 [Mycobacterium bouchedurhonense]ORB77562.1 hypothetical protein BST46_23820 [Mycobacterium timonense]PBA42289.1 hypothetical protein CKJ63_07550 [Mycobacterium avium]PBA85999.1 hypothetical protein CKJ72_00015 [Mycobacterium avium]TXA41099.1 hypothetical protein DKM27_15095 [Mycobacterium tuberculosis variant bovis]